MKTCNYKPNTPRNIAIWALVLAYGKQGRDAVVQAIVDAGIHDTREWSAESQLQQARNHVSYLERMGWVTFAEVPA